MPQHHVDRADLVDACTQEAGTGEETLAGVVVAVRPVNNQVQESIPKHRQKAPQGT